MVYPIGTRCGVDDNHYRLCSWCSHDLTIHFPECVPDVQGCITASSSAHSPCSACHLPCPSVIALLGDCQGLLTDVPAPYCCPISLFSPGTGTPVLPNCYPPSYHPHPNPPHFRVNTRDLANELWALPDPCPDPFHSNSIAPSLCLLHSPPATLALVLSSDTYAFIRVLVVTVSFV